MTALSVGLTSCLLLALQIALMQAVSHSQGYHLANVMLSIALLGFGAGGSVLTLWRRRTPGALERIYGPALLLCGLSVAWLPLPMRLLLAGLEVDLLFTGWSQWARLIVLGSVLLLPFFTGALALSVAFATRPMGIGRLYAANLLGSAVGAAAILPALRVSLPEHLMPYLALLAFGAALPARPRRACLLVALLGILAAAVPRSSLPLSPYKALSAARQFPAVQHTGPQPHPFGRVDVVQAPALRYAPDLSLRYHGPVPAPPHIFNDGQTVGVLLATDDPARLILEETPRALPFVADPVPSVLFLAPDGTPYPHLALARQARVTLVEPHPRIADLLRKTLPPAAVHLVTSDPRQFLSRADLPPYDLIVFPVRGLFGGPSGLQTLGEDSLFTVEAVQRAFTHLTPGGRLAFNVWLDEPLRHALRVTDLAIAALQAQGATQPCEHLVLLRGWGSLALLVGREPMSAATIRRVADFAEAKGFDLLWPPQPDTARRHGEHSDGLGELPSALAGPRADAFRRAYRFDIRAPTDDRPFFNQFLRLNDRGADLEWLSVSERGLLILKVLLLLLTAAVLVLVFGPLLPLGVTPTRAPFTLLYFTGLGAGFMLFEIALIHRLAPLWGHTVTSAALVITALLGGMGLGSAFSRRLSARPLVMAGVTAGSAVLTAGLLQGLGGVLTALMPLPAPVRLGAVLLLLTVPAIPLGIPFPLGVRWLAARAPRQIPWACGIDGAVAVLAAPAAALLAFQFGYPALTLAAAGAYGLATVGALLARARPAATPEILPAPSQPHPPETTP